MRQEILSQNQEEINMEGQGKTDRHRSAAAIKTLKTTAMILFIAFVAVAFIYVVNGLFDVPSVNFTYTASRLSNVNNIRRQDNTFVWDSVKHATYYVVEVNGTQFTVNECLWHCPDKMNVEFIRVKAVDSSGWHGESDWTYYDGSSYN